MTQSIPVITIDGPSGAGKGTVSRLLASRLGWNYLDSGAIYRSLAVATEKAGLSLDDLPGLVNLAQSMPLRFEAGTTPKVWLGSEEISALIQTEDCGNRASQIAVIGPVRQALLEKQISFRNAPGLVADGRDMGTVVFPDAPYKVFLTASAGERALRRYKQLKEKGIDVSLARLTTEIEERDERDAQRSIAPLKMAVGAMLIDSSALSIEEVLECCLELMQET